MTAECARDGGSDEREEPSEPNGSKVESVNSLVTCLCQKGFSLVVTRSSWTRFHVPGLFSLALVPRRDSGVGGRYK